MADKWSKKECVRHLVEIKSPYDAAGAVPSPTNANPDIQRLVEAGKQYQAELAGKQKGVSQ